MDGRALFTSTPNGLSLENLGGMSYAPVVGMGVGGTAYTRIENWMSLCVAPCTTRLMPGTHYFRVVGPDGTVYGRRRGIDIEVPGTLTLGIHPRHRKRRWLWATTIVGLVVGATGILVGVRDSLGYEPPRNPRLYPGGLIVGSVFAVAGLGAIVTFGVGGGRPGAIVQFRPHL